MFTKQELTTIKTALLSALDAVNSDWRRAVSDEDRAQFRVDANEYEALANKCRRLINDYGIEGMAAAIAEGG